MLTPRREPALAAFLLFALLLLCAPLAVPAGGKVAPTPSDPADAAPHSPQTALPAPEKTAEADAAPAESGADQDDSSGAADGLFSPTYQTCMDEAAGAAVPMQVCMDAEVDRLEKHMTAQRARLTPALSQERSKALAEALEAWEKLRKSGSAAMYDAEGGTLSPLMASLWYLEQTARMSHWLDSLQENAGP